jgi:hypothetical protein
MISSALGDEGRLALVEHTPLVELQVKHSDVGDARADSLAALFIYFCKLVVLATVDHESLFFIWIHPEVHRMINSAFGDFKRIFGILVEHHELTVGVTEHLHL